MTDMPSTSLGGVNRSGFFRFSLEHQMKKLILPVAIFISVIIAGKASEHFGLEGGWKIGLLCIVAAVVQILITRHQRTQR